MEPGDGELRSGQLCLYTYTCQACSGVNLLASVCTVYSSLLGSGVSSPCLLGKEKPWVFFLLFSNVNVQLQWLCLGAAWPLKPGCVQQTVIMLGCVEMGGTTAWHQ